MKRWFGLWLTAAAFTLATLSPSPTRAADGALTPDQAREENAYAVGLQAYLWGYPLRYYGITVPETLKVGGSYVNDLRKFPALKTAKDRFVVTPNNVTIDAYSAADVSAEPVIVFVPTLAEPRWYIVQVGDFFDEIIRNVGGTKGPQPGVYVITGPRFHRHRPRRNDPDQEPHPSQCGCCADYCQRSGRLAEGRGGAEGLPRNAVVGLPEIRPCL